MAENDLAPHLQRCENCGAIVDMSEEQPLKRVRCSVCSTELIVERTLPNLDLEEIVGEGGMGTVYRARDLSLHREVAVKLLNRDFSKEDQKNIDAMLMEARIMASISHQNIVKVYSCNYEDEQFYIVMEFLESGSLDDMMETEGRIDEVKVLHTGIDVAQGLKAAHEAGLVHRDVKPGNILYTNSDMAKIVDFGLARPADQRDQEELEAEIWGTPYYVPPETLNREPEDFRSDIYSLGATLFHALAGRPPFEAENASLVAIKHLKNQAVSLKAFAPDAADETAYVINRMLHKEPDERFNDYDELIDHFEYALEKVAAGPRKNVFQEQAKIESQKTNQLFGLVTISILLVALILGVTGFLLRDKIMGADTGTPEGLRNLGQEALTVERDLEAAEEYFADMDKVGMAGPADIFWADYHLALINLLQGEPAEEYFEEMARIQAGRLSDDVPLNEINFFSNTGKVFLNVNNRGQKINDQKTIPVELAQRFDLNSVQAMSYLVFGLKNWNQGDFEAAHTILSQFQEAQLPKDYREFERYKPLVDDHVHDSGIYVRIKDAAEQANTSMDARAALEKLRELRPKIRRKTEVLPYLLRLEQNLERKL